MGIFLINAFMDEMRHQGYDKIISLTANPRLESLYTYLGFEIRCPPGLEPRQARSPGKKMFLKNL